MIKKLNAFTAFLPLIGLLPNFQGTDTGAKPTVIPPKIKEFNGVIYTIPKPNSDSTSNTNTTAPVDLASLFIKDNLKSTLDKQVKVTAASIENITVKMVSDHFFNIIDKENKLKLDKENTLWVQQTVSGSNNTNTSKFVPFKSDKDIDIKKVDTVAILVPEVKLEAVNENIDKWKNSTVTTAENNPDNQPNGPAPTNNKWGWKKIVGYSATGIFVALCIGGVIYYFFVPTKDSSSLLSEEEDQYEEDEEYEEL